MHAGLTPYNDATRAVIEQLLGVRSRERMLVEFFGIAPTDRASPAMLREKRVWWTPVLQELGFDEKDFALAIRTLCPDVPAETFDPPADSDQTGNSRNPTRAPRNQKSKIIKP